MWWEHATEGNHISKRAPQEQEVLSRQIEATDGQIDRLVYGLTDEEIKIVDGA